jgi:CDP-diacylglycerol--serine O-phosphatidyltransferase
MRAPKLKRSRSTSGIRRGIYIIPSLFTVGNIFCGFYSVVESSRGHMERSSVLIMVAIVLDILDGRIARMTGASSTFGETFDSLADVISFGVAPSLLVFNWGLWQIPRPGTAVAFLFLVAGAIRLARFSATTHTQLDFVGLPSPAGAGSIALFVLISPSPVQHPGFIPVVACFVIALALLMVSNLPYRSFKDVNMRRRWPVTTVFVLAIVVSLATLTPHVLSVLAAIYVLSAPFAVLTGRVRTRPTSGADQPTTSPARSPHGEHHDR